VGPDSRLDRGRRTFLLCGGAAVAAAVMPKAVLAAAEEKETPTAKPDEGVSPAEDLMREHAVLSRILLIYDAARDNLSREASFPPDVVAASADIVKRFIEEYHEKLEEDHIFPRFRKAGKLVTLVDTLKAQHDAGRKLTERITSRATKAAFEKADERRVLVEDLRLFTLMYLPHKAREGTVLFPAIHSIISPDEYDEMGDQFEDEEHKMFGEKGFFGVVDDVAALEERAGIADLAQFTPKA
jgi:hemerythrin-like domain-containing protein